MIDLNLNVNYDSMKYQGYNLIEYCSTNLLPCILTRKKILWRNKYETIYHKHLSDARFDIWRVGEILNVSFCCKMACQWPSRYKYCVYLDIRLIKTLKQTQTVCIFTFMKTLLFDTTTKPFFLLTTTGVVLVVSHATTLHKSRPADKCVYYGVWPSK